MAFIILVDYDNIEASDKSKGLIYIVERALSRFSAKEISEKNVVFRLYGGWYENNSITRRAQDLNSEIATTFPKGVVLGDNLSSVIVNAELALSLKIDPRTTLFNTLRTRGNVQGIRAHAPSTIGCYKDNCPVFIVHDFVSSGKCGLCRDVAPKDVFFKTEQKLIDTMLTSDMINIGRTEQKYCLLSSDDDFWPGILSSILEGATVYHLHTKGQKTPKYYSRTVNSNYFQKLL